jgi:hypothetical protein
VVIDSRTGDIIIKVVSLLPTETDLSIALGEGTLNGYNTKADFTVMAGDVNPKGERDWKTNGSHIFLHILSKNCICGHHLEVHSSRKSLEASVQEQHHDDGVNE